MGSQRTAPAPGGLRMVAVDAKTLPGLGTAMVLADICWPRSITGMGKVHLNWGDSHLLGPYPC